MVDVFSYLSSKHSLLMDRLVEMECVRERPHSPLGEDILSEMLSEDMLCSDQESEDDVPLFNAKGFPTVAGKCPRPEFLVSHQLEVPLLNAKTELLDPETMLPLDYENYVFELDHANEYDEPIWNMRFN